MGRYSRRSHHANGRTRSQKNIALTLEMTVNEHPLYYKDKTEMSDMNSISSSINQSPEHAGRILRAVGDNVQQQIKTAVHKELIKRVDLGRVHTNAVLR